MNQRARIFSAGSLALLFALTLAVASHAQQGGRSGFSTQATIGPQEDFDLLYSATVPGDYIAAGVGLRDVGSGSITLSVPAGATINKAWMFWAIIWDVTPPATTADLNGTTVNGTKIGTSGSPCWGGSGINFYYADVTGIAINGANAVANVPSGNPGFPLAEGATIVAVFDHPAWDYNDIAISVGAQTFSFLTVTDNFGSYTGWSAGNPADQTAQTTFIVADGQARFAGDGTAFNATATSGPGTGIKTVDAFDNADGRLWDTHTLDVSSFFPDGVNTPADASVIAGIVNGVGDCLTWGVQVVSVKSALNAFVDVKAGSCPNSVNINNNGVIPVSVLGTSWFDVAEIEASTVTLEGVSPFGAPSMGDVSTPYMGFPADCYDCNLGGADTYSDLTFKFKTQDVVAALGSVQNGDCYVVTLSGMLKDNTPFKGYDVLRIIDNSAPKANDGIAGFALDLAQNAPNPVVTGTSFQYTLPEAAAVRLQVFNTLGQLVASVVDGSRSAGAHTVAWDGLSNNGTPLTPGSYIYRLTAGSQVLSKMLVITR